MTRNIESNRLFHGPEPGPMARREDWTHDVPRELLGWAPSALGPFIWQMIPTMLELTV